MKPNSNSKADNKNHFKNKIMKIGTKLLRGKYYCYATIDGYDYSFHGGTVEEAQSQMRNLLQRKGTYGLEWEPVEIIKEPEPTKRPPIGYATSRIDNNPTA